MIKIKNKKANGTTWTGQKIGNLIFAVLVILALIFLIVRLYFLYSTKTDVRKAEDTLNQIIRISGALSKVGDFSEEFFLGPEGWYLLFLNADDYPAPSRCGKQDCLCLCEEPYAEVCDAEGKGFCKTSLDNKFKINTAFDNNFIRINTPSSEGTGFSQYKIEKTSEDVVGVSYIRDFSLRPFLEHVHTDEGLLKGLSVRDILVNYLNSPDENVRNAVIDAFKRAAHYEYGTVLKYGLEEKKSSESENIWKVKILPEYKYLDYDVGGADCQQSYIIEEKLKIKNNNEINVVLCIDESYAKSMYFGE